MSAIHEAMRNPLEGVVATNPEEAHRIAPVCARCSGAAARKAGLPLALLVESALIVHDGEVYRVIARCHGEEGILEVRDDGAGLAAVERSIRAARMFGGK